MGQDELVEWYDSQLREDESISLPAFRLANLLGLWMALRFIWDISEGRYHLDVFNTSHRSSVEIPGNPEAPFPNSAVLQNNITFNFSSTGQIIRANESMLAGAGTENYKLSAPLQNIATTSRRKESIRSFEHNERNPDQARFMELFKDIRESLQYLAPTAIRAKIIERFTCIQNVERNPGAPDVNPEREN
jgi:hypothetical protein